MEIYTYMYVYIGAVDRKEGKETETVIQGLGFRVTVKTLCDRKQFRNSTS